MAREAPGSDPTLTWQTFRDFTGGLYERGSDRDVPPNGLTRLDDAIPMPAGGLQPAPVWTVRVDTTTPGSSAGITPSTGHMLLGFDVFSNAGPATSAVQWTWMMLGQQSSYVADQQVWLSRSSAPPAFNAFTTIRNHTSVLDRTPIRFVQFAHSTFGPPELNHYYHLPLAPAAQTGVWKVDSVTLGVTQISTANTFYLATHQARLIAVYQGAYTGAFAGLHDVIGFSDDGTDNNLGSTANQFTLAANRPDDVVYVQSRMPGDLVFLKRGAGWFTLQGAMAIQPVVYEAARVHPSQDISFGVETPFGLAYLTRDEGVWAFTGGQQPGHMSSQFEGTPMTSAVWSIASSRNASPFLGQPAFGGHYFPTPRGYVMDTETQSWYRATQLADEPAWGFFTYDETNGQLYAARNTTAGGIQVRTMSVNEQTTPRSTAYMFEVPVLNVDAFTVVPAELEFYLELTSPGPAQLEVAIIHPMPGTADTTVNLAPVVLGQSRHQTVRVKLPFAAGGVQWFKVRPILRSLGPQEAPTLAYFRVGTRPGAPVPVS